jgi:putative transposase
LTGRQALLMRRFKSARQLQRFASVHGQVSNQFMARRYNRNPQHKREARAQAFAAWERASCARMTA